ncbi:unnamed protein product [Cylicocyclus nassatus]|uniref:Uncharacterized protein n=1 Tax=Cylicocyclus nassatus TaxID=53992 RepID=A0AA36DL22_CYLNA|nr:unnamed protein product [Cylicocyclus nassatus]
MSLAMVIEATRAIFHARPASLGWKRQSDESDKLGSLLQQHPNGYIGGLVEMWLKRDSLIEIADSKDVYRQRGLRSVVDTIADVLREDNTSFNPVCRASLIFACGLVCSTLEGIFGRPCQRIDELIKNTGLDRLTANELICRLSKGISTPHADARLSTILHNLNALPVVETLSGQGNKDAKHDGNSTCENLMNFELAEVPSFLTEAAKSSTSQEETSDIKESGFKRCFANDSDNIVSQSLCENKAGLDNPPSEENVQGSDKAAASDHSSDLNDVSSVAPSRSVCEQVETLMAGVKYCKERDHGKEKRRIKEASENLQKVDTRNVPVTTATENKEEHHVIEEEKRRMSDEVATGDVGEISQEETTGDGHAVVPSEIDVEAEVETVMEPKRLECAKILSDDHLDCSPNQDQSLRTKWLPDNGFCTSNSPDNLVEPVDDGRKDCAEAPIISEQPSTEENEWKSFTEGEDITSSWKSASAPLDDVPDAKVEKCATEEQIKADEIPVLNPAASQKKNETEMLLSTGNETKRAEHASPTMDGGKTMVKDTPFAPPIKRVNTPEKPIISFDADDNPDGFDGDQFDRPRVFTTTHETVFCTKTFDEEDVSDPSTDDDIAGVFMRSAGRDAAIEKRPSINGCEQPPELKAKFAAPPQAVNQVVRTENPLPDEEVISDVAAVNLRLHKNDEKVQDDTATKIRRESENTGTNVNKSRRESESLTPKEEKTSSQKKPAKDDDDGWDDGEAVKQTFAQDTKEQVKRQEDSRPSPPQTRFLSGGFESTGSGFGGFGGGHSEKENSSYGSHGSFRERKNSYESERSGGGGGRGGFRGGGRMGGRGYDSAPRDNYRDRDRDSRDGFRGRGGYGGSGRGSRSYEGRGGFHGNRA